MLHMKKIFIGDLCVGVQRLDFGNGERFARVTRGFLNYIFYGNKCIIFI